MMEACRETSLKVEKVNKKLDDRVYVAGGEQTVESSERLMWICNLRTDNPDSLKANIITQLSFITKCLIRRVYKWRTSYEKKVVTTSVDRQSEKVLMNVHKNKPTIIEINTTIT